MEIMDDISKDEENETSVENNNSCGDIINEDPVDAAKQPEDVFEIDKILNNCRDSDGGEIVADVENKRNFSNLAGNYLHFNRTITIITPSHFFNSIISRHSF